MSSSTPSQVREALIAAGITGPHQSHSRGGTIAKIHGLLDGDRDATMGLSGIEKYAAHEILGFMSELTGCAADISDVECEDLIDPDLTVAGIVAAADRLAEAASSG